MVPGDAGDVLRQALARPQARQDRARHVCSGAVVADERHPAGIRHLPRGGLGDVVKQRPKTQRLPASELVRERLAQEPAHRPRLLAEHGGRLLLQLDHARQHRKRVLVDVQMVVGALLDLMERAQLGQDDRGEKHLVHQPEALHGPVGAHDALDLREYPLRRNRLQAMGGGGHGSGGSRFDREAELAGQAHGAQRP